jgi:TetR/AcrR family transcriptional regulator, regulator of biofilm formation and stress response
MALEAERPRRVRRGQGRQALLEATVRIVARAGLDGLTIRSAAREAGVTHGLATYHFRSRDAMVAEALEWATEQGIEESRLDTHGGNLDDLAADLPELIARDPESAAFQFAMALEGRHQPALAEKIRELYDHYIATTHASLEAAGLTPDAKLSQLVFAAIDGLVLQQLIYGNAGATEQALRRLRHLLTAEAKSRDPSIGPGRPRN